MAARGRGVRRQPPLYTYEQLERALADAGVSPCGGAKRGSHAPVDLRRRRAMRSSSRSATTFTPSSISTGRADRVTDSAGPKIEATFSPDGRSVAFSQGTTICSWHVSASAAERALTIGRQREAAERHARLGLFRRAVRSRQPPRLLVEPRLVPHRVPAARRTSGPGIHAG